MEIREEGEFIVDGEHLTMRKMAYNVNKFYCFSCILLVPTKIQNDNWVEIYKLWKIQESLVREI